MTDKSLSLKYGIKSYPFSRYYPVEAIKRYVPISGAKFLSMCSRSKKYHGIIVNKDFFVHPDTFVSYLKEHFRRKITTELRRKVVSNPP